MNADPGRPSARVEYIRAEGGIVPYLGGKIARSVSDDGAGMKMRFQVTPINPPLVSVSKLATAGDEVVVGLHHESIMHPSAALVTHMRKDNGVYVLNMWVAAMPSSPSGGSRR